MLATFGRGEGRDGPIASLLECTLETGRTHQVRVHLAHIGHPLIGDPLYGHGFKSKLRKLPEPLSSKLPSLPRQALHAARLGFVHPATGTLLEFNSTTSAATSPRSLDAFKRTVNAMVGLYQRRQNIL